MHSSNKALIIGTGFGSLYKSIYEGMGWEVTTIDIADPKSDYKTVVGSLVNDRYDKTELKNVRIKIDEMWNTKWDTCHITTPNYTHYELADTCAMYSDIVFVEKPGVSSMMMWSQLLADHPDTRIMMVKNNQYRSNIPEMAKAADPKKGVTRINWINDNRVPKPGSWFTNKKLAFGGVSRDLMPHLLSLYQMFEPDWRNSTPKWAKKERRWNLEDLTDSDYGEVDPNGVYDVDDFAYIDFGDFQLQTNWRACASSNVVGDDIAVHTQTKSFELGLCPESAYKEMIKTALFEKSNDKYWQLQMEMDLWIHQVLDNL